MGILENLMLYDFTNFKLGNNDPKENHLSEVMKVVPRGHKNHKDLKEKVDKELGFDNEGQHGISYPTLIKYLALALEDMEGGVE